MGFGGGQLNLRPLTWAPMSKMSLSYAQMCLPAMKVEDTMHRLVEGVEPKVQSSLPHLEGNLKRGSV